MVTFHFNNYAKEIVRLKEVIGRFYAKDVKAASRRL